MRVLSLFDGISCGMVALHRAGILPSVYDAFEIDKYAIAISKYQYQKIRHHGNVFGADFNRFDGCDLLLAGSPCQFWSISKKKRELDNTGEGWKLFSRFLDALRHAYPKYFLYENVASMPQQIRDSISTELGVQPILINSNLVSAQQRKRLYWTNIPNVTQPEDKQICLQDVLVKDTAHMRKSFCLDASYYKDANLKHMLEKHKRTLVFSSAMSHTSIQLSSFGKKRQGERIYSVRGKAVSIKANGGGQGANTGLYFIDLPDGDYYVRKLTPMEAERCQTLPENYTSHGINEKDEIVPISNTQRYKCIGNGWTVDVISHILKHIPLEDQC